MNNDFVNKALESARVLQQTVADAVDEGGRAGQAAWSPTPWRGPKSCTRRSLDQAPQYGEAAQTHLADAPRVT